MKTVNEVSQKCNVLLEQGVVESYSIIYFKILYIIVARTGLQRGLGVPSCLKRTGPGFSSFFSSHTHTQAQRWLRGK